MDNSTLINELTDLKFVIDGGSLIHRIPFGKNETYSSISQRFVVYLHTHYPGAMVKPLLKINTECVENWAIKFIEDYIAIPECTKLNKYNIQDINLNIWLYLKHCNMTKYTIDNAVWGHTPNLNIWITIVTVNRKFNHTLTNNRKYL